MNLVFAPSFFKVVKIGWFTVPRLADIVSDIHKSWPDCAITLSVGEMEHDAYQTYLMPALTVIYFVMKLMMMHITVCFILLP